jgi:hypothetical protein
MLVIDLLIAFPTQRLKNNNKKNRWRSKSDTRAANPL